MNRSIVLCALVASAGIAQRAAAQKSTRPHVVLILTDQQRFDALGVVDPRVYTPNLDALARQGVLFSNGYVASPSSTPARGVLLTGMTPWHAGMVGYYAKVAPKYPNELPQMLADAGYHTIGVGKMHYFPQRNGHGFQTLKLDESGRVESEGFVSDYRAWFASVAPNQNPDATGIGWNEHRAAVYALDESLHPTRWTADEAIRQIKAHDAEQPMFLKLSFARPHSPYDPPQRWFDFYKDRAVETPWVGDWCGGYADRPMTADAPFGDFGTAHALHSRRHYNAAVSFVDEQIGRVVAELKAKGIYDQAVIVFTSDHGDMLGDHHHWRKTYPYEGSAHIPFIVRLPGGVGGGQMRTQCVGLRDIMPTLLEAAGVAIPETVDGQSLLALVKNRRAPWRAYIEMEHSSCYQAASGWVAMTDGRTKYVWQYNKGTEQLFDMQKDPHELHNAASDARYAKKIALWRTRMASFLQERGVDWVKGGVLQKTKFTGPLNENYPL